MNNKLSYTVAPCWSFSCIIMWLKFPYLLAQLAEKARGYILSKTQVHLTSYWSTFVRCSAY